MPSGNHTWCWPHPQGLGNTTVHLTSLSFKLSENMEQNVAAWVNFTNIVIDEQRQAAFCHNGFLKQVSAWHRPRKVGPVCVETHEWANRTCESLVRSNGTRTDLVLNKPWTGEALTTLRVLLSWCGNGWQILSFGVSCFQDISWLCFWGKQMRQNWVMVS